MMDALDALIGWGIANPWYGAALFVGQAVAVMYAAHRLNGWLLTRD